MKITITDDDGVVLFQGQFIKEAVAELLSTAYAEPIADMPTQVICNRFMDCTNLDVYVEEA